MAASDKSPIIERLCKFMEYSGLTITQFADKAGIPRPSLSQMLHGRNKSLNNQVLAKLNATFPELNIVWLLFGNGTMLSDSKIKTSGGENNGNLDLFQTQTPKQEDFGRQNLFFEQITQSQTNSKETSVADDTDNKSQINTQLPHSSPHINHRTSQKINEPAGSLIQTPQSDISKRVKSILVLYSDGSFETFIPGGNTD